MEEFTKRYFWHRQWIFKYLILPKMVQIKEWEMSLGSPILKEDGSSNSIKRFTGAIFEVKPHIWIYIRFLSILLSSNIEYLRIFAANKYKKIRVKYTYPAGLIGTSVYSIMDKI